MVNTSFLDLEIHIFPRSESGYPIHLRLSDGQDFAGNLAADLASWTPTGNPQADGRALFEVLFASPKLREAWGLARGADQRRIRLWLDANAPELHTLPWELLHDGQTFLAADAATPFSRYLPSAAPWGGLVAERPIRILAVIANPTDLAQYNLASLDVAAECALLTEALGDLAPTHFRLEILEAPVTLERLERALASGPHVLHFVGHGTFGKRSQEAVLYLQDAAGNAQPVTDAQLCDMLRRQAKLPSLIFLAACQSAERSTVDAFAGLAPRLVQVGIPAVVAMQDRVALSATRKLTPVFYEELAQHGEVDRALNAARSLLLTGQSPDAATPVLLMRLADGKLWEPLWAKTNPYRGLAAFTEADAKFFFGRESLITELSDKVRRQRFIAVVGPSGSGKSSVVQAGLLPRLPKDWQVIKLRPGSDPYANSEWRIANGEFPADPLIPRAASGQVHRSVLFIDQFEELFALCSPEVQMRFLDDVQALIASPAPVTVILTLRADFFGHLQASPLGKHLEHALVNVLPMDPADLRAAIECPAQVVGLHFETGLVETISEDARQARHTLPLLQAALTQLWEQQTQGTLTYDAYVASGRVPGAIGLWAEDTYNGLTEAEQWLARRVFTRLVHYGEGDAADTRQRRALPELLTQPDEHNVLHRLLQRLADARLLTTDEAQDVESVEIIHDALLKEWPRLEQWLTEQREFYLWRQRLSAQLQAWQEQDRDSSALLRGKSLDEAARWLELRPDDLNVDERVYIRAGMLRRKRQRIVLGSALVFFILTVLATIFGIQQRDLRVNERARATEQAALATATVALGEAQDSLATATVALSKAETERQRADQERDTARNAVAIAEASRIESENARADVETREKELKHQLRITNSRNLANQSQFHSDLSLLFAIEAVNSTWMEDREVIAVAEQTLRDLLYKIGGYNLPGYALSGYPFIQSKLGLVMKGNTPYKDTFLLWDLDTHSLASVIEDDGDIGYGDKMVVSPDGHWLVLAARYGGPVTLRDLTSPGYNQVVLLEHKEDYIDDVIFTSNDRLTILSYGNSPIGGDMVVRLWDLTAPNFALYSTVLVSNCDAFISSNGQWLITQEYDYDDDGELHTRTKLWDLTARDPVRNFKDIAIPDLNWGATEISPDGQWFLHIDWDCFMCPWGSQLQDTAILHNLRSSEEFILTGHSDEITAWDFSPDGRWLSTGDVDGMAHLWDLSASDPSENFIVLEDSSGIQLVDFSPNGRWLVTGAGSIAHLWDISIPDPSVNSIMLHGHNAGIEAVAFSSDGHWLVTSDGVKSRLWDLVTPNFSVYPRILENKQQPEFLLEEKIISADGHWLVTDGANSIQLWNLTVSDPTLEPIVLKKYNEEQDSRTIFSPDGHWLLSVNNDEEWYIGNTGYLWDLTTAKLESHSPATPATLKFQEEEHLSEILFSPDGQWLIARGEVVRLWDLKNFDEYGKLLIAHGINTVSFSPDGHWLVTVDENVELWNLMTPDLTTKTLALDARGDVFFSPDGDWLATTDARSVHFWDLTVPDQITEFATWSSDQDSRSVRYWFIISSDGNPVMGTSEYECDDSDYYCGYYNLELWDLTGLWIDGMPSRMEEKTELSSDIGKISAIGYWLVVIDGYYTVTLWPLISGDSLGDPIKLESVYTPGNFSDITISSDGTWLIIGDNLNKEIRIWNLSIFAPSEFIVLYGYDDGTLSVTPDGHWIVNESDELIKLWTLRVDDLLNMGCFMTERNLTHAEWTQYLGDEPYRATCPNLPIPED